MGVQQKYNAVMDALNDLVAEESCTKTERKNMLYDLRSEIDSLIHVLEFDEDDD